MIIPNTLTIMLQTSIPGLQKIKFKPSMIIPGDKQEEEVYFNPLIKLNKNIIEKIPENIRVGEFFNKNLFDSLINAHGIQKSLDLKQATEKGFVNNNIYVTLKTIFNKNTIIYIGGNPYSIFDFDWEKGNWVIKLIEKDVSSPYKYNNLVKPKISKEEKELNDMPLNVKEGDNYVSPNKRNTSKKEPPSKPIILPVSIPKKDDPNTSNSNSNSNTNSNSTVQSTTLTPSTKSDIKNTMPKQELKENNKNAIIIQNYFKQTDYLFLINQLFEKMYPVSQKYIQKDLVDSSLMNESDNKWNTIINKNKINYINYLRRIYSLNVFSNDGGGNCFFIAVCQAINNYNTSVNDANKISYTNNKQIVTYFTITNLREIVYNTLIETTNLENILEVSQVRVDEINKQFAELLNNYSGNISSNEYLTLVDNVYKKFDNFLIKKPITMPTNPALFEHPFIIISNPIEIKKYIESSDYWADETVINLIQKSLNLTVIPIQNNNNYFSIPYVDLEINNITSKNKYMFLYYNNNHYELIGFNFWRKNNKDTKFKKEVVTIFNVLDISSSTSILKPPIYIIFLLYASYYFNLNQEKKENITLFKLYFNMFDNSFERIVKTLNIVPGSNNIKKQFLTIFNKLFPSNKTKNYLDNINNIKIGGNKKEGESSLTYLISIELALYPGQSIPKDKESEINCKIKWNKIRKSYSNLTNQKYVIKPEYKGGKTLKNKHKF
jgi:hypothetical protein